MKKIILYISITLLFSGCTAQRSIEYLAKMKYKIHSVTDFEADNLFGGRANTVNVISNKNTIPVHKGFIVCNDRT